MEIFLKATDNQLQSESTVWNSGFKVRTYKDCCIAAQSQADPRDLFKGLWYEGELTALYADTNVGKSILAVQIAEEVARKGFKVFYLDLELSDKGVEKRSRDDNGKIYDFSENLYRAQFNPYELDYSSYDDLMKDEMLIFDFLENAAQEVGANVIIIDNITALNSTCEEGASAVKLVTRLLRMRDNNKWSILFLAHTPKLDKTQPITRDSMAGSKRFISLIDSAFAIGECAGKTNLRYIKQTKVRLTECVYHENNVLVCEIKRVDGLLQFIPVGTDKEWNLIQPSKTKNKDKELDAVVELKKDGMSLNSIATQLGVTKSRVQYLVKVATEKGLFDETNRDDDEDANTVNAETEAHVVEQQVAARSGKLPYEAERASLLEPVTEVPF